MESKAQIRKKVINRLKIFPTIEKKRQTSEIIAALTNSKNWQKAHTVALYMPTSIEFDLAPLFLQAQQENKKILIPKCLPHRQMIFSTYEENNLECSKFGLLEPKNPHAQTPDFILVPGLAWNKDNYRIGFGGGYYDRYLSNFTGATASVYYDFQAQVFTPDPHDIKVDQVFTTPPTNSRQ